MASDESCSTLAFSCGEWRPELMDAPSDGRTEVVGHCARTGPAWEEYSRGMQELGPDAPASRKYGRGYRVFGTTPRGHPGDTHHVVPARSWFCVGGFFDPVDNVGVRAFRAMYRSTTPTFFAEPNGTDRPTDIIPEDRVPKTVWRQHIGSDEDGTEIRVLIQLRRLPKVHATCRNPITDEAYVYYSRKLLVLVRKS